MLNDLFDLTGETAVVTGAGRGIGEGIAKVLAAAGASVICAARRADEIQRVADEINAAGGTAKCCATDVTDLDAVNRLAKFACDETGGLHMWVNNAGGSPVQKPLHLLDQEEWDRTLALNLTAAMYASGSRDNGRRSDTQYFLPGGRRRYCWQWALLCC